MSALDGHPHVCRYDRAPLEDRLSDIDERQASWPGPQQKEAEQVANALVEPLLAVGAERRIAHGQVAARSSVSGWGGYWMRMHLYL